MTLRLFLFAIIGVGLTGFLVYGWRAMNQPPPVLAPVVVAAAVPVPVMLNLIVASRDLVPGSFIRSDDLSTVSIGQNALPPGGLPDSPTTRARLIGAMVRRPVLHEAALLPSSDLLLPGDHGFLAAILAPGMRAFTISRDQVVADAGLVWPGDRLDLILTQQMPSPVTPTKQVSAETVLTDLRVLAIDRQLVQPRVDDDKNSANPGNTGGTPVAAVTVEVTPADAERLAVAVRLGKVTFTVRAAAPSADPAKPADRPAVPLPGSTTWAGAVMHAFGEIQPPPPPPLSVHVFEGVADQEYKF